MKSFLVSFFLLFLFIGYGQNVTDSKGRKQGEWSKTYPGSRAYMYKGQFVDNKPVGTFTYFYPSTKVKAIIKHDPNSNRSVAYYYHENKVLMSYGIFRDMKKDSLWLNFGPSGRISNTETYKKDSLDGKKTVYYVSEEISDNSKRVSATYIYVNGKLNGDAIQYFENGGIKVKGGYLNNKKHGEWISYHANGQKMMFERYKNGVNHGWHYAYDTSGKEIAKEYIYKGQRMQGKDLELKMKSMKEKGINPNE